MTASAVHGGKPTARPSKTPSSEAAVAQSTSFSGAIAAHAAASSSPSGSGLMRRHPCTVASSLTRSIAETSSAEVHRSPRRTCSSSIPQAAQRFSIPRS